MMSEVTITQPPARPLTPAEEQLAQAMAAIARRAKMRYRVRTPRRKANVKPRTKRATNAE